MKGNVHFRLAHYMYVPLFACVLYTLVCGIKTGKLTCSVDELFVKSIGHQWLRKAPLVRWREEQREGWGGGWRVKVSKGGDRNSRRTVL